MTRHEHIGDPLAVTSFQREVVVHADDLGASHGMNAAFAELSALGICTCGSVMVPCPWFAEVADMAAQDRALDIGVHLTLNSEYAGYKWRPLTRPSAASGLTDENGFFHSDVVTLRARARPEAVEAELRAQIDAALAAGIDVTHLDDHMAAVLTPEFFDIYLRLGLEYRLPILVTPSLGDYGGIHNLRGVAPEKYRSNAAIAEKAGFRIFDRVLETPWDRSGPAEPAYRDIMNQILPGTTFMALHFCLPGEITAITPDSHQLRTDEYHLFRSDSFRSWMAGLDLVLTGMRPFRDDLRTRLI